MSRISIGIIHNHDRRRLAHILPAARALAVRIGAPLFEVHEQPPVKPHSICFALYREAIFWRIIQDWERYRGVARASLMRSVIGHTIRTIGRMNGRFCRSSAVEMVVKSKHVRAWESFIADGGDYLVVLEDDAVFQADTADRFCAMLDILAGRDMSRLLYVDLAGGHSIERLGVSSLIAGKRDGFIHFSRPVTNSAGGYLMSRATVQRFCRILASRPWFRCTPIDWLMNGLMVSAHAEGSEFDCWHSSPLMFQHGSVTGSYTAWVR